MASVRQRAMEAEHAAPAGATDRDVASLMLATLVAAREVAATKVAVCRPEK